MQSCNRPSFFFDDPTSPASPIYLRIYLLPIPLSTPHLIVDDHIVLGRHVIGNIMIHNQPKQPIKKCQVDFLVHLLELGFHHHVALALRSVPDVL